MDSITTKSQPAFVSKSLRKDVSAVVDKNGCWHLRIWGARIWVAFWKCTLLIKIEGRRVHYDLLLLWKQDIFLHLATMWYPPPQHRSPEPHIKPSISKNRRIRHGPWAATLHRLRQDLMRYHVEFADDIDNDMSRHASGWGRSDLDSQIHHSLLIEVNCEIERVDSG